MLLLKTKGLLRNIRKASLHENHNTLIIKRCKSCNFFLQPILHFCAPSPHPYFASVNQAKDRFKQTGLNQNSKHMFNNISWQNYLIGMAIALAVYYLVVGLKFYRSEIRNLYKPRPKRTRVLQEIEEDPPQENDELVEIENLISRVKEVFEMAKDQRLATGEVEEFLNLVFAEYPSVKHSDWRDSVNELVVSESEKVAGILLTTQQVNQLWAR